MGGRGRSEDSDNNLPRSVLQIETVRQGAPSDISQLPEIEQRHLRVQTADGRLSSKQRHRLYCCSRTSRSSRRFNSEPPSARAHSLLQYVRYCDETRYSRYWHHE